MTHRFRWLLLMALTLMMFLINVDYTAVNLALLPIAKDLHADLGTVQWVLSAYTLSWAVLVIPAGNLVDRFSKKKVCLGGIALFLVASVLAGCAESSHWLIVARLLQGAAGAIFIPTLYALITLHFPETAVGRAMGIMSLGVGIGLAAGPFIGGVLIELLNWRSIFFINLPLGLLAFSIIYASPADQPTVKGPTLYWPSVALLGLSLSCALYSLGEWQVWSHAVILYSSLGCIAVVAMASFLKLQVIPGQAIIPVSLIKQRPFLGVSMVMFFEQFIFSVIIVVLGLFFQKISLFSALKSGIFYLALTLFFSLAAALAGPWLDKQGLKIPIILGFFIIMAGTIFFQLYALRSQPWLLCVILATLGTGLGFAFTGLNTGITKTVPTQWVGVASSVFVMSALLGNTLGVILTTMLYQRGSLQHVLLQSKAAQLVGLNQAMLLSTAICLIAIIISSRLIPHKPSPSSSINHN